MPPMTGPLAFVRSRIAVKLTLTLVGFVALSMVAAGLYLNRAHRERPDRRPGHGPHEEGAGRRSGRSRCARQSRRALA